MKRVLSILIIILILSLILSYVFFQIKYSCRRISCITLNSLNNFKLQQIFEENSKIFRSTYFYNGTIIRTKVLSGINTQNAVRNITAEISRAKGLYADAPAPYPGSISDTIVCDPKFVAKFNQKKINNIKVSYFTGFMTQRQTFGACSEEEAFYKGIFTIFYCSNQKKLYQLEIISPKNKYLESPKTYEEMLLSISCKI